MAKILFLQLQQFAYPGLYYICGVLRERGHEYEVLATNRLDVIHEQIEKTNPDVVGFPCMTGIHKEILKMCSEIKHEFADVLTLLGGVPPTLHPQTSFSYDDVPMSFFNDTVLKKVNRNFILNLHSLFQIVVLMPWLKGTAKLCLRLPHNALFRFVFKAVYSYVCIKSERRTVISFIRLALANRRLFK